MLERVTLASVVGIKAALESLLLAMEDFWFE
jgi:hypothetical protein